jgi:hypothetical protein
MGSSRGPADRVIDLAAASRTNHLQALGLDCMKRGRTTPFVSRDRNANHTIGVQRLGVLAWGVISASVGGDLAG